MHLYLWLVNLALLFSFTIAVSPSGRFYKCGGDIIKETLVKAAVKEGCDRYYGRGVCNGLNCFKPNSLPALRGGNFFPSSNYYIEWPIKTTKNFRKYLIGYVGLDISVDNKCDLIGVKYRQSKDKRLIECEGPISRDSLSQHAELDRTGPSSQDNNFAGFTPSLDRVGSNPHIQDSPGDPSQWFKYTG